MLYTAIRSGGNDNNSGAQWMCDLDLDMGSTHRQANETHPGSW
jgi:hypothetical protein